MSVKPEDIMPAGQDYVRVNGAEIRKGTMAAAITNARIVTSTSASEEDKTSALNAIRALVPALRAFGLMEFLQWKDPQIQAVFDEA